MLDEECCRCLTEEIEEVGDGVDRCDLRLRDLLVVACVLGAHTFQYLHDSDNRGEDPLAAGTCP